MSKTIKKYWRRESIAFAILGVAAIAVVVAFFTSPPVAAARKTKIDTPTINCAGSTQASINITVCAPNGTGATGLPAGFTLQWITAEAYALGPDGIPNTADDNSWPSSDAVGACDASFSGNANLSRYNLAPGTCVTVNVGDFLFDEGASTSCPGELTCGTEYLFRAFGHATSTLNRSDWSANADCSTLECDQDGGGCTLTQGYWKTHNDTVCAIDNTSPLCVLWPTQSLTLGTVTYDQAQLLSILNTPASGNGLIALAHQLIAAKLNIAAGADGTAAAQCIADADALIGGLVIPPVGSGYLAPSATSGLITCLTNYNEGATGPGHCL